MLFHRFLVEISAAPTAAIAGIRRCTASAVAEGGADGGGDDGAGDDVRAPPPPSRPDEEEPDRNATVVRRTVYRSSRVRNAYHCPDVEPTAGMHAARIHRGCQNSGCCCGPRRIHHVHRCSYDPSATPIVPDRSRAGAILTVNTIRHFHHAHFPMNGSNRRSACFRTVRHHASHTRHRAHATNHNPKMGGNHTPGTPSSHSTLGE